MPQLVGATLSSSLYTVCLSGHYFSNATRFMAQIGRRSTWLQHRST